MTRGSITPDAYHLKAQISRFMRSVRCCSRSSLVPQGQLPSVSQPVTGRLRLVLHHLGCSSASGIVASLNSLFHSTTITESKEITPPPDAYSGAPFALAGIWGGHFTRLTDHAFLDPQLLYRSIVVDHWLGVLLEADFEVRSRSTRRLAHLCYSNGSLAAMYTICHFIYILLRRLRPHWSVPPGANLGSEFCVITLQSPSILRSLFLTFHFPIFHLGGGGDVGLSNHY